MITPVRVTIPSGKPFYGPYDAQEMMQEFASDLDITMVPFQLMVFVEDRAEYMPIDETTDDQNVLNISGTEFRRRLQEGLEIPEWFSYPKVVEELRKSYPPRHKQGVTIFFHRAFRLGQVDHRERVVDQVARNRRSSGDASRRRSRAQEPFERTGFSKEHRDLNIMRIGFVASEICKNGGIAICAPIAPYTATRRQGPRNERGCRRFHRGPCGHLGRGL